MAAALAAVCAGAGWGAAPPAGISWESHSSARRGIAQGAVIVRARPGRLASVEASVRRLGGRITRELGIINGFTATLPRGAAGRPLSRLANVLSVSADTKLQPDGTSYDPVADVGSVYNTTLMTGAQAYWRAGFTGEGVDVALIDSGVVPVDGLTAAGKVVNGPDLSEESQGSTVQYLDTYGHGTFMAGLIAGRANAAVSGAYAGDSADYLGMAPGARIVSVKVADAHGATDVSQVIAALDWVVQHRNDNGLNVRVINLSYGTNSSQPYTIDPLAYAAGQAWKAGIVVVAAAGNTGFNKDGSLSDPAYDPTLLAVGAADTNGTVTTSDDFPAAFSSSGKSRSGKSRLADLLAPGTHIVGLRDRGSYIDQTYNSTGAVTSTLFRGSGSSQATAIVSGAAALILQQHPSYTPDQVKALLTQSATFLGGRKWQGRNELNLNAALTASLGNYTPSTGFGTGTGLLEGARGSVHVSSKGVALTGEQDIFGMPFQSGPMAALEASVSSWSGGLWNGSSWSGSSWSGSSWSGSSWSGSSWSGSSWSGSSWSGSSWSTTDWSGQSWADRAWADAAWN